MNKPASRVGSVSQLLAGEERRRSQRVVIRVPLTLIHVTAVGGKDTVRATTVSVNDHGAMILCPRSIPALTIVEIQNDRTQEKQKCRITRAPIESAEGYLIPLEFSSAAPDYWRISFPPTNWKPVED
jgi:hypothetical protein